MGTPGYRAYRYKNRYYRKYTHWDSYPSGGGQRFADLIPRDSAEREAWVQQVIKGIDVEMAWRKEQGFEDRYEVDYQRKAEHDADVMLYGEHEMMFQAVLDHNVWVAPDASQAHWTYVIDLDYRAFTVNGSVHFNFDNMPPDNPGIQIYFEEDAPSIIPEEYLTKVSQWPNPNFDEDAACKEYDALKSTVLTAQDWGIPTWDSLSVAQHLSTELVKTIVSDYRSMLSTPDLASNWSRIALICWQIACAAAPCHLLCPGEESIPSEDLLYTSIAYREFILSGDTVNVPYYIGAKGVLHVYCWFRGCLVAFCTRLDEELYVKREVGRMVKHLRNKGRTRGLGAVMSSYQMVAVAVDGSEVRHSPLMDIHNGKGGVKDGLLLLMHLLSPSFTVNKTPWAPQSASWSQSSVFPDDVIRHIIHLTDDDTHHFVLPLVSHLVRAICLEHPRVQGLNLLSVDRPMTFKVVRSQGPTTETYATLVRSGGSKLHYGLQCMFQHHQTGVGAFDNVSPSVARTLSRSRARKLSWKAVVGCKDLPATRIQVVEGMWFIVEAGKKCEEQMNVKGTLVFETDTDLRNEYMSEMGIMVV